jgi:hypothetical protein
MALPSSGAISTNDIMGPNGLNIGVQTKIWYNGSNGLWDLAAAGSIPKNKAIAGGPFILPNDWWGYGTTPVFSPYSYTGEIQSVSTGPSFQFTFQMRINTSGAPSWNQIIGGSSSISITQGTSGTNGVTNVLFVGGTIYQCNSVQGIVSNTVNATITLCNIRVSDGSTQHTHTFAVPVTFTPTEIGNGAIKSVSVNVT